MCKIDDLLKVANLISDGRAYIKDGLCLIDQSSPKWFYYSDEQKYQLINYLATNGQFCNLSFNFIEYIYEAGEAGNRFYVSQSYDDSVNDFDKNIFSLVLQIANNKS